MRFGLHIQKNDKVYSLNGLIYNDISTTTSAALNEASALEYAKDYVGASVYKWELPKEEQHLKWETNDPLATYEPIGELVFVPTTTDFNKDSYRLAYKFNIYAHTPVFTSGNLC